ncbi:condensation domain-containing protein [Actinacidiphila yeochonensis]|uniref:hypothetical protein n=1 Tax=Actinacidiphila yeochonensis TaxID=89050 RepID=UPI000AF766E6|nr:hypothetical protein [Actinacidiphila yeochonensis]
MAETTRHHLPVRGGRSATAPATWGQRSIWTDIEYMMPDTSFYNSTLFVDVPPGASREGVFAALTATVARHDSLRTLFQQAQAPAPSDAGPADSGAPTAGRGALTQTVEAEGSLAVDVVEAYTDRDDLAEVAGRMDAEVTSHRFDHAREWPVRATVGVVDGAIVVVGLCLSHLAADNGSLRVVRRDLEQLLRVAGSAEGVRAAAAGLPAPGLQPVELAEEEGSPSGQRMLDKALEHWRGELAAMPPTVFPGPPLPPESPATRPCGCARGPSRWPPTRWRCGTVPAAPSCCWPPRHCCSAGTEAPTAPLWSSSPATAPGPRSRASSATWSRTSSPPWTFPARRSATSCARPGACPYAPTATAAATASSSPRCVLGPPSSAAPNWS